MGRAALQTTAKTNGPAGPWAELVSAAKAECAIEVEVCEATRHAYEDAWAQLNAGKWDLASAPKGTRYVMRAAGLNMMRRQLRALMKQATKALNGEKGGTDLLPVRMARHGQVMQAVQTLMARLDDFKALRWKDKPAPGDMHRVQKSHKQRPATDAELLAFYEAASNSSFRIPLLVSEFSGCRGEEFKHGIRIEACNKQGVATLQFFIQGAKTDGKKKGIDVRCIEVPFPKDAAKPVQRRWLELANLAAKKTTCTIQLGDTEKQTVGVRFTNACKMISTKAGVHVAAYSLRNRFSAQTKQANAGDAVAVALALGHQTTETQRHYARASRGGGSVSPVASKGVNIGGYRIRGASKRTGPPAHVKTKTNLKASTPQPSPAASRSRGMRL